MFGVCPIDVTRGREPKNVKLTEHDHLACQLLGSATPNNPLATFLGVAGLGDESGVT
jgi:hypothetical protein